MRVIIKGVIINQKNLNLNFFPKTKNKKSKINILKGGVYV